MSGQRSLDRAARSAVAARLNTDERLAQRAARGDKRAFAAIYRRYDQRLYRFCLSILGNAEDARDALQGTMLKALKALPGEQRQIQLKPWLYRVAHNESVELLRKHRDTVELDANLAGQNGGPVEIAAQRERLRQLLHDLAELPERQRAMLLMRELGGLDLSQIGEAFETSPAVVRQTVYEARMSLRQLEGGREMSCEEVMHRISNADGRKIRRRDVQAHLRGCADCREFRDALEVRQQDLAALAPLPAIAATGILHAVLGGASGTANGAAVGTAAVAGAGKVAATSATVKSVAAVALVGTVGITAADRGGLIDAGLPGGAGGPTATQREQAGNTTTSDPTSTDLELPPSTPRNGNGDDRRRQGAHDIRPAPARGAADSGNGQNVPGGPPAAKPARGRETAAARKAKHGAKEPGRKRTAGSRAHRGSTHGHGDNRRKPKGGGSSGAPASTNPPPTVQSDPAQGKANTQPGGQGSSLDTEQSSVKGAGSTSRAESMP